MNKIASAESIATIATLRMVIALTSQVVELETSAPSKSV